MLTATERENIRNFSQLSPNYQYILRWRIRKKCIKTLRDLEYLLLHAKEIGLKTEDIISLDLLGNVIEACKDASFTESVKIPKN